MIRFLKQVIKRSGREITVGTSVAIVAQTFFAIDQSIARTNAPKLSDKLDKQSDGGHPKPSK